MNPAAFFAEYDSFGERRAGGPGDAAAADWLRARAEAVAGTAALIPVPFTRFEPGAARLDADGITIEGLPLYDGGTTGPEGVTGRLGPLGSDAPVGFVALESRAASLPGNEFARARRASAHRAIVAAPRSEAGSLSPLNAHDIEAPFGPPVLQVPGREAARLAALAESGATVRVIAEGRRGPGRTSNIRAALDGAAPPLVLLTPRTSWWTSTAERAGGILAWLRALEALARAPRRRAVVALATGGHEIGHAGAHLAFAAEPALAADSHLVLHLGANLGCAGDPRLTVRSNRPGLADRMAEALAGVGYPRDALEVVSGGTANGEAHEIAARGGRYVSLIGDNPWFHAPEDRWPQSVDPDRAAAIGRAAAAIAVQEAA